MGVILRRRQTEFRTECECGTLAQDCSPFHVTTVKFDELFRNYEAESATTMLSGTARIDLAEGFEDQRSFFLGKAAARIND